MTRYSVEIDKRARKQIAALRDLGLRDQIEHDILSLAENPRPTGVKKLAGYRDLWRIRVDDWRIVYRIENGRLVVVIVTVAKRDEVYAGLGR